MAEYHLILVFPEKNIKKIKDIFQNSAAAGYLYLGKDFLKKCRISKNLGSNFKYIDIAKILDKVALEIKKEHVEWIDNLNRKYGDKIEWWFGAISSRNIYESNLFQYSCYLEVLNRIWESDTDKPSLIFIESFGLAKAIEKWAKRKNLITNIINLEKVRLAQILSYLHFFNQWCECIFTSFLRAIAFWFSGLKMKNHYPPNYPNPYIILDTYILNSSLQKDGAFKDSFYPYLYEYLQQKGIKALIHPVFYGFKYNYFSIFKRIKRCSLRFIIQEKFLALSDYLCAFTYPIRVLKQKIKVYLFRNIDLSDIVNEDNIQNIALGIQAVLIYRLFLRLGKTNLLPRAVIDWHENQVIDKALIAGARTAFPGIKIIGAQIFIHSPNFLSIYPSQSEVEKNIVPDILLETSEYQCQIAKTFTDNILCRPAASLRYAHVFNDEDIQNSLKTADKKTILILLPFEMTGAIELLETFRQILDNIEARVIILIKCHPNYTVQFLIKTFGIKNWPSRFRIFQGSIEAALGEASLVISSNSSAIIEAAVKGIPVIFVARETVLNQNFLSDANIDMVSECFCGNELIKTIDRYLNISPAEFNKYREIGKKLRSQYFSPVNENNLSQFLVKE